MKILLASNNKNKIKEIKNLLVNYEILSLKDINFKEDIIEDGKTFYDNALIKVKALIPFFNGIIIADDSGLEVESLNNLPGVHSKRYSNTELDKDNNLKLLKELKNKENRKAKFKTSIVLYYQNNFYHFEGVLNGIILKEERGYNGFGYDPLFYVPSLKKTLAELSLEEKNKISHRSIALNKLKTFLKEKEAEHGRIN